MQKTTRAVLLSFLAILVATLTGCAHPIKFEDVSYKIDTPRSSASLVAVIDEATLNSTVTIRSASAGIANRWQPQPGIMLRQVADVELPQMFSGYEMSTTYKEAATGDKRITLLLTVPSYRFSDFHATYTVKAAAYGPNKTLLFENTYTEEGDRQKGKMINAGAFGMKSAVRQSSLDALKKVFVKLRADLAKVQ